MNTQKRSCSFVAHVKLRAQTNTILVSFNKITILRPELLNKIVWISFSLKIFDENK